MWERYVAANTGVAAQRNLRGCIFDRYTAAFVRVIEEKRFALVDDSDFWGDEFRPSLGEDVDNAVAWPPLRTQLVLLNSSEFELSEDTNRGRASRSTVALRETCRGVIRPQRLHGPPSPQFRIAAQPHGPEAAAAELVRHLEPVAEEVADLDGMNRSGHGTGVGMYGSIIAVLRLIRVRVVVAANEFASHLSFMS
ncbi:hypothetical protein DL765_003798 [Monosporascus sp. GIB2]|nr:hypothetical protein DL765_003798 [Monosporascus sp. GIB2]